MELIDRNALGIGRCNPEIMLDRAYAAGWNSVIGIIEQAPAIDPLHALGACYCRECKHCLIDLSDREYHICMRKSATRHRVSPTDFCSYGERKQNEILD